MFNRTVYLVKAYSKNSGNHIWIGGEQSSNIARARYWEVEADAQDVVDTNQKKFDRVNIDLESHPSGRYTHSTIVLEVVSMTRKELMVEILKG